MSTEPFYVNGLRFECTGCSSCCRHEPGYVFLTRTDLLKLSDALGMRTGEFRKQYCRSVNIGGFSRLSLKEKDNYDCIFWEEGGCSVYKARPVQCSTYPFWSNNLGSKDDWNHLSRLCPGANRGRLYSMREIKDRLQQRAEEPLLEGDE